MEEELGCSLCIIIIDGVYGGNSYTSQLYLIIHKDLVMDEPSYNDGFGRSNIRAPNDLSPFPAMWIPLLEIVSLLNG